MHTAGAAASRPSPMRLASRTIAGMPVPTRRGQATRRPLVAGLLLLVTLGSLTVPDAGAQSPAIEVVAELELPDVEGPDRTFAGWTDEGRNLLYMWLASRGGSAQHLLEYDLATDVPKLLRVSSDTTAAFPLHFNNVAQDQSRRRALVLAVNPSPRIEVIDLATLTIPQDEVVELRTVAPGFNPTGMSYHEPNDRIYIVGHFSGNSVVDRSSPAGVIPAVVAIDAATFDVDWIQRLDPRSCPMILTSSTSGALAARSLRRPMLYVFCSAGTDAANRTYSARQNALLRVDLSGEDEVTGVAEFAMEAFPISGNYAGSAADRTGLAAFDPGSERVFLQSVDADSPGAWVFDGLRSSWVGFIPYGVRVSAELGGRLAEPVFYGLHPRNGRYFMAASFAGDSGSIVVADGRATPVDRGEPVLGPRIFGNVLPDPSSNRLFANFSDLARIETGANSHYMVMMRDNTQPIQSWTLADPDSRTHDLPDDEALLIYSSQSSGYGSRHTQVGGYQGLAKRLFPTDLYGSFRSPGDISTGPRGAVTAYVDGVGLAQSGAAAAAAVGAADEATDGDLADKTREVNDAAEESVLERPVYEFPYGELTCLDGADERIERRETAPGDSGTVEVECDLAAERARAASTFSGQVSETGAAGSTSYTARTYRDPERGIVTETVATSDGIQHTIVGVGTLTATRVVTESVTTANGLPGGASARWTRRVEDLQFTNALGIAEEPQTCTTIIQAGPDPVEDDDCQRLASRYDELLGSTTRLRFPMASVVATPLGALARVVRTESDQYNADTTRDDARLSVAGMEMEIINDGAEKSRSVVEYAGIEAFSIFTRSPIPPPPPPYVPDTPMDPPTTDPVPDPIEASPGPTVEAPVAVGPDGVEVPVVLANHEVRLVAAFGWLARARGWAQAVLIGALYGWFLIPIIESRRRRQLLSVLTQERT